MTLNAPVVIPVVLAFAYVGARLLAPLLEGRPRRLPLPLAVEWVTSAGPDLCPACGTDHGAVRRVDWFENYWTDVTQRRTVLEEQGACPALLDRIEDRRAWLPPRPVKPLPAARPRLVALRSRRKARVVRYDRHGARIAPEAP